MTDKNPDLIWNAHVQELWVEGTEVIEAFEGIERALREAMKPSIVEHLISGKPSRQAPEQIAVDRRYLELLVDAFNCYKAERPNVTMGQAFGLESAERGKQRSLTRRGTWKRNTSIAIEVTDLMEGGLSKQQAIDRVAEKMNMTSKAVSAALRPPPAEKLKRKFEELSKKKPT